MTPKPYEIYRHFKGNCYQILCIAQNSETASKEVIYQGLYEPYKIYARDLDMFMEKVDRDKYPDVKQKYRFELLNEDGFVVERDEDRITDKAVELPKSQNFAKTNVQGDQYKEQYIKTEEKEQVEQSVDATNEFDGYSPEKAERIKRNREEAKSINPLLAAFLDATSEEEQLKILLNNREDISEDILLPMELSLGIESGDDSVDGRIYAIRNCLELKMRYERSNRYNR